MSLLTFRLFQPYAFTGPGFFGLKLDPTWLSNMRQAQADVTGDVDFPFALQWARRTIFFAGQNMLLWGLGLPLGILAAAGFLWVTWRIFTGQWRQHFLLWSWTGAYFAWQSSLSNPTMRYLLPIYPMFAIFAGWAVVALYDLSKQIKPGPVSTPHGMDALGGCAPGEYCHPDDRRLGVCLYPSLCKPDYACGGLTLDLPEYPRADRSAHPNLQAGSITSQWPTRMARM